MRADNVIAPMLELHERLVTLPPPRDRGYYTAAELAQAIGRKPTPTDATALRNLGWLRTARRVNDKTARVWIPPSHAHMILNSTPT